MGKVIVLDLAVVARLENNDVTSGVIGGIMAYNVSASADVNACAIAADIVGVMNLAVEQQVIVAADPHAGGGAVSHFAVGNRVVISEQLNAGNISSVRIFDS